MKIVYFLKNITAKGGIERVVINKANYLARHGHDVTIVSIRTPSAHPFFTIEPRVKLRSLHCDHFFRSGLLRKLDFFSSHKKQFAAKAREILQQIQPDVSIAMSNDMSRHLHLAGDSSIKVLEHHFAKNKSAQFMYLLEKSSLGRAVARLYQYKMYNLIKRYRHFVVLTEEDREAWGDLPNIHVIPNAISFSPTARSPLDSNRVIALGRITPQKDFKALIDIWQRLKQCQPSPGWRLSIFGDNSGKEAAKLLDLSKKLNILGSVEIRSPTQDVEKELLGSSILAMTSRYEGFGMVLIEAMSCGVPVLAFACKSGPRDIIRDGEDGFLIPVGNKAMFIQKLTLLINDPELLHRMGEAAARNVQRFSEEMVMARWITLFQESIAAQSIKEEVPSS